MQFSACRSALRRSDRAIGISSTSGGTGKMMLSAKLSTNSATDAEGRYAHASVQSYRWRCTCHHATLRCGPTFAPQCGQNSASADTDMPQRTQVPAWPLADVSSVWVTLLVACSSLIVPAVNPCARALSNPHSRTGARDARRISRLRQAYSSGARSFSEGGRRARLRRAGLIRRVASTTCRRPVSRRVGRPVTRQRDPTG